MILKNNYYYYKGILETEFCDKVLELGKLKLRQKGEKAGTFGDKIKSDKNGIKLGEKTRLETGEKSGENIIVRDSEIAWLDEKWIYNKIIPIVNSANQSAGWNFQHEFVEPAQFTKYGLNQYYGWHYDGGMDIHNAKYGKNLNRKLSVTINLVDETDYEGGNLRFDFGPHQHGERYIECKEIRPRGSVVVFPSFIYHQVTPVTKGTRYSLVMWFNGKPFK